MSKIPDDRIIESFADKIFLKQIWFKKEEQAVGRKKWKIDKMFVVLDFTGGESVKDARYFYDKEDEDWKKKIFKNHYGVSWEFAEMKIIKGDWMPDFKRFESEGAAMIWFKACKQAYTNKLVELI